MDDQRLLVPYPEARHLLGGIGRSTFFQMVAAGQLTKVAIGSRAFVTMDSLRELVQRNAAKPENFAHDHAVKGGAQ